MDQVSRCWLSVPECSYLYIELQFSEVAMDTHPLSGIILQRGSGRSHPFSDDISGKVPLHQHSTNNARIGSEGSRRYRGDGERREKPTAKLSSNCRR